MSSLSARRNGVMPGPPIGRRGALFVDVYSPAVQFSRELRVRAVVPEFAENRHALAERQDTDEGDVPGEDVAVEVGRLAANDAAALGRAESRIASLEREIAVQPVAEEPLAAKIGV